MKNSKDRSKVLNELYKISRMGMEASEIILPRVERKDLSEQIKRQDETYINLMEKTCAMLKEGGEAPVSGDAGAEAMLRGSVRTNTFFRRDSAHIARLMINGTNMGIIGMTHVMNHTPDCDVKTKKLAEDYLKNEEQNVDKLKKFL